MVSIEVINILRRASRKSKKCPPPESYSESAIRKLYKCIHLKKSLKYDQKVIKM